MVTFENRIQTGLMNEFVLTLDIETIWPQCSRPPKSRPQPYKTLKDTDVADGEEQVGSETAVGHTAPASPVDSGKISERMDPGSSDWTRTLPGLKHSNPYNKLWSMGQDDMAIQTKSSLLSSERPLEVHLDVSSEAQQPPSTENTAILAEKTESTTGSQCSITIPRPHGRKTPELGKVLAPPVPLPRSVRHLPLVGSGDAGKSSSTNLVSEFGQESIGTANKAGAQEFRQALNASPLHIQSQLSGPDILKPIKVGSESGTTGSADLLSLLDPLSTGGISQSSETESSGGLSALAPGSSSNPALFTPLLSEYNPPSSTFVPQVGYSPATTPVVQFQQASLNPFAPSVPARLHYPAVGPPGTHYAASASNPFSSNYLPPTSGYFPAQSIPKFSASSLPSVFNPPTALGQVSGTFVSQSGSQPPFGESATLTGSAASLNYPRPLSISLERPLSVPSQDVPPVTTKQAEDPFEDLLTVTKQEVLPGQGRVDQLRKRWETFE
ncbi:DEN1A protein, partial [Polypterus senegalus]